MLKENELYKKAVEKLNSLQSNAQVLSQLQGARRKLITEANVPETILFLKYLDLSLLDLDHLNCLHITGTKGKGSTAAFVEAILRKLGFKTGLYSSPHLVHVRERIRIDGRPIREDEFADYVFKTLHLMRNNRSLAYQEMPGYFKFLTLMAFRFFVDAKVDVAIIEVGIGGENDCTNIIQNPVVCGCSTLDLDHCRILGNTLEEIAWQKAGIMKPKSVFVTVKPENEKILNVFEKRSQEKQCQLQVAPEICRYSWPKETLNFGIDGKHQNTNVSLALQLVRFWILRTSNIPKHKQLTEKYLLGLEKAAAQDLSFNVPHEFLTALEECFWPGRSQILRKNSITYYLDGAHTLQSIKYCVEWFNEKIEEEKNKDFIKILIFHCTGDRDSTNLLTNLYNCSFDLALFCPIRLKMETDSANDNTNRSLCLELENKRCISDSQFWDQMNLNNSKKTNSSRTFPSIEKTLEFLNELERNNPSNTLRVLVTGSLHLVGGVLYFTNPNITD